MFLSKIGKIYKTVRSAMKRIKCSVSGFCFCFRLGFSLSY